MMNRICLFVMLGMIIAAGASAATAGPDSSFDEIRAAGLFPRFATISFQTESVTIDELCVDGTDLRPVHPNKTTCSKWLDRGRRSECIEFVTTYLSTPISHPEEVCLERSTRPNTEGECLRSKFVTVDYLLTYNVSIYENRPRAGIVEVFRKPYTIPACEN